MNRTASSFVFGLGLTFPTALPGASMDYRATVASYTLPSIQEGLDARLVYINGRCIVLTYEEYESLSETASILNDPKSMSALTKGAAEIAQGKGISWQKAKAKLGL